VYYDSTRYTPGNNSVATTTGGPVTVNRTGNHNYIGCFSEATNGGALTCQTPAIPAGSNTIENCEITCQGFTYFGKEYSNESKFSLFILLNGRGIGAKRKPGYCGNVINHGSAIQSSSDPNTNGYLMLCGGNTTEYVRTLLAHLFSPNVLS